MCWIYCRSDGNDQYGVYALPWSGYCDLNQAYSREVSFMFIFWFVFEVWDVIRSLFLFFLSCLVYINKFINFWISYSLYKSCYLVWFFLVSVIYQRIAQLPWLGAPLTLFTLLHIFRRSASGVQWSCSLLWWYVGPYSFKGVIYSTRKIVPKLIVLIYLIILSCIWDDRWIALCHQKHSFTHLELEAIWPQLFR